MCRRHQCLVEALKAHRCSWLQTEYSSFLIFHIHSETIIVRMYVILLLNFVIHHSLKCFVIIAMILSNVCWPERRRRRRQNTFLGHKFNLQMAACHILTHTHILSRAHTFERTGRHCASARDMKTFNMMTMMMMMILMM